MLGNLFEDLTHTLTQAKDLNKILLEELRVCHSKLHEHLPEFEEIENEIPDINDEKLESVNDQDKQDFEINETSHHAEHELIGIQMKNENVL